MDRCVSTFRQEVPLGGDDTTGGSDPVYTFAVVRLSLSARMRITCNEKCGVSFTICKKRSSPTGAMRHSVRVSALALLGFESISAISPNRSPGPRVSTSTPLAKMSTSPRRMTYMTSPGGSSSKMTVPSSASFASSASLNRFSRSTVSLPNAVPSVSPRSQAAHGQVSASWPRKKAGFALHPGAGRSRVVPGPAR